MGADQVLEWEVVDGTGRLLRASPLENADLYWALSGGGGGTFGIVSSVVVKTYPDMRTSGVQLAFNLDTERPGAFYNAVNRYHELVPEFTAAGGMAIALITNSSFLLTPLTLPNMSQADAEALVAPLARELDDQGLHYNLNVTEYPNWLSFWQQLIKPNPTQLVQNAQFGGWMVPRSVVEENPRGLQAAIQDITKSGCDFVGLALNASMPEGSSDNSILPSWRSAAMCVILSTYVFFFSEGTRFDLLIRIWPV